MIELNKILKQKAIQSKALDSNEVAQFHIITLPGDIRRNCKFMDWKKIKDDLQFGRQHPVCKHPEKVKEYVLCKAMLLGCINCPFYTQDN